MIAGPKLNALLLETSCDTRPWDPENPRGNPPGYPNSRCGSTQAAGLPGLSSAGKRDNKPSELLLFLAGPAKSAHDDAAIYGVMSRVGDGICSADPPWPSSRAETINLLKRLAKARAQKKRG